MVPSPRFELGMLVRLFLRQVCLPFHQEGETVVNCVVPQARFERAIATVFKAAVSTDSTIGALTILCGASPRIRTSDWTALQAAALILSAIARELVVGDGIEPPARCL